MFYCVSELLMCFIGWGVPNGFYCVGEFLMGFIAELMCFIVWVSSYSVFYCVGELLLCFIGWGAPSVFYWVSS